MDGVCFRFQQLFPQPDGRPPRAFALRSRRRSRSLLAALKEELRFTGGAVFSVPATFSTTSEGSDCPDPPHTIRAARSHLSGRKV